MIDKVGAWIWSASSLVTSTNSPAAANSRRVLEITTARKALSICANAGSALAFLHTSGGGSDRDVLGRRAGAACPPAWGATCSRHD